MDQERDQNQGAPQPEEQPAGTDFQPAAEPVPVAMSVEEVQPSESIPPQVEEVPVNPFASPESSAPAASPAPTGPTQPVSPFAPEPQVDSVPPVFATASAPTPLAKESHKGLIIGLIVGFVVLLLAIGVAGYIWFTNFYVAKADYQQASSVWTQLHDINTSLSSMEPAVFSSSSTTSVTDVRNKVDELDNKIKQLGTLRAVQKDPDLKKAYDALLPNVQEQVVVSRAAANFIQATNDCGKITVKTQVASCATGLRGITDDSKGGTIKALASAMADYLEGAAAGKSVSYTAQENDFSTYTKDLEKKVSDTGDAFSSALSKKV